MESPVVIDKPPEYHGNNERGFPFDEDEASGAWSELAARHPDIAARLRQRPAGWSTKRRPNSQDNTDDFDEGFGARFPFDDIPAEFREHFPTHWNRRFREEPQQAPESRAPPTQQQPAKQTQTSTQTENQPQASSSSSEVPPNAADADRNQRSMSAPPGHAMSREPAPTPAAPSAAPGPQASVRHIPIFVEGRDEPVLPREAATPPKPNFVPPPPPGEPDYFDDEFFPPRNVARAFGVPFASNYRAAPQPFTHTKAFPQAAAARGASPQREEYVRVPVHHERPETPTKQQRAAPQQQQFQQPPPQQQQFQQRAPPQQQHQQRPPPPQQQHQQRPPPQQQQQPPQQQQEHQPSPPPQKPQPSANDPITQILSIQTDVLNLMTEVENFTGSKKDKRYVFLDEMLTRNLIKLDNIETDGKENIRQARKEAIRCIQKCIAVLEAKAEKGGNTPQPQEQPSDVDMKEPTSPESANKVSTEEEKQAKENSEPQMENPTQPDPQEAPQEAPQEVPQETKPQDEEPALDNQTQPQPSDTRPDSKAEQKDNLESKPQEPKEKKTPKKGKAVKKRDKSKETKDTNVSSKQENVDNSEVHVDNKGDSQSMEVDGATSQ